MAGRTPILLLAAIVALFAGGCRHVLQPDLERLYGGSTAAADQPPVILIPGLLGTRIVDRKNSDEIWIGSVFKLLFSDYRELTLPIDPVTLEPATGDTMAGSITDRAAGRDFYGSIIRTLEATAGYRRAEPGTRPADGGPFYYIFSYDWRQDNVASARRLHAMIEQIRADHDDPDLEVDVIAHSMGGLITRYYLRYGTRDVLDDNDFPVNLEGAQRIRRVILLGTPNLGSVNSLHAFIRGYAIGLTRIPTEVVATFPSVYQLFPHPINDWIVTAEGKRLDRDVFSTRLWRRFQWSIFAPEVRSRIRERAGGGADGEHRLKLLEAYFHKHIERARRFVWSLTVPTPEPMPEPVVLGGDCSPTPARIVVEEVNGKSMVRLWPDDLKRPVAGVNYRELMLQPGDGTVTKASLLARQSADPSVPRHEYSHFPLDYPIFLCAEHDRLTQNLTFQDNLLHILLSRERE